MAPASIYERRFKRLPRRALLLKGHSAGIGDILRSSAAWRSLHDAFPGVELHLALLTQDPGAASESLMARHHLLRSFQAIDKRTSSWRDWRRMLGLLEAAAVRIQPDLIIDFEPNGLKSSLAAWRLGRRFGAATIGIAQFPGRGAFYQLASGPAQEYARRRGLEYPLEYTNRDYVCLSALGLERNGTPIELEETGEAKSLRQKLQKQCSARPVIGLNIGCGTPDAASKRPDLQLLKRMLEMLRERRGGEVLLTGAKFEQPVNQQFLSLLSVEQRAAAHDLAGQTNLVELCGVIRACDLFVSTDSGPYHMAVGLKVPTLAVFRWPNPVHYHHHPHVRCVVLNKEEHLEPAVEAGLELLRLGRA